jgi:hypothetical protein
MGRHQYNKYIIKTSNNTKKNDVRLFLNPKKLATLGTEDEDKQNKNA